MLDDLKERVVYIGVDLCVCGYRIKVLRRTSLQYLAVPKDCLITMLTALKAPPLTGRKVRKKMQLATRKEPLAGH